MRLVQYTKRVLAAKLHDELEAAIPALRTPADTSEARLSVRAGPTACTLAVPDDVPNAALDPVVAAHDPTTVIEATSRARLAEAFQALSADLQAATTLAQLRAANIQLLALLRLVYRRMGD